MTAKNDAPRDLLMSVVNMMIGPAEHTITRACQTDGFIYFRTRFDGASATMYGISSVGQRLILIQEERQILT